MQQISFVKCSNGKRCLVCGRKFTSDFQCTTHIKASKSDRQLDCRYCYKSFKHKGNLTKHERVHTGVGTNVMIVTNRLNKVTI